jgi:hypothetical protein
MPTRMAAHTIAAPKATRRMDSIYGVTIMAQETITDKDREMAQFCLNCPLCKRARAKQKGPIFWFVKNVEGGMCPYCQAYERVYGRKSHEPKPFPQA